MNEVVCILFHSSRFCSSRFAVDDRRDGVVKSWNVLRIGMAVVFLLPDVGTRISERFSFCQLYFSWKMF